MFFNLFVRFRLVNFQFFNLCVVVGIFERTTELRQEIDKVGMVCLRFQLNEVEDKLAGVLDVERLQTHSAS